ncbi:MAG: FecR domain-containing protein [Chitinophagaceae bacterium]|nr:FecR domain-containing protein [Chitinophagaceae bacterium]
MKNEQMELLMKKQVDGTISPEEQTALYNLMADPANEEHFKLLLQEQWTGFEPKSKTLTSRETKTIFSELLKRIKASDHVRNNAKKSWLFTWRAAAAGLLVLVGAAAVYFAASESDPLVSAGVKMNQVTTQPGSKTKLELSDGTQVWLHSNSKLVYNEQNFGKTNREVTLDGEAFFDVAKNAGVPFVIHTGQVNITVKGTAFNVKAYPSDKAIETTLLRGLIEITTLQDPDRKILLKPNEKISIPVVNISGEVKERKQDTSRSLFSITRLKNTGSEPAEVAWVQNQLVFDNEPLSSIAPKMASWYNIEIQFSDEEVTKKHFSGTIERETLKETLEAMKLSFPFEYEITGNVLFIRSK